MSITSDTSFTGNSMKGKKRKICRTGSERNTDSTGDLEQIRTIIIRELGDIESIYLFGSLVKGNIDESSDYDIAVVMKNSPDAYIGKISAIRYALLGKTSRPVDIIILDYADLKVASPIVYEILQHNRLLFGRDILPLITRDVKMVHPIVMDGATVGYHV